MRTWPLRHSETHPEVRERPGRSQRYRRKDSAARQERLLALKIKPVRELLDFLDDLKGRYAQIKDWSTLLDKLLAIQRGISAFNASHRYRNNRVVSSESEDISSEYDDTTEGSNNTTEDDTRAAGHNLTAEDKHPEDKHPVEDKHPAAETTRQPRTNRGQQQHVRGPRPLWSRGARTPPWGGTATPRTTPLVSAPATGRTAGGGGKEETPFPPRAEPAGPTIADLTTSCRRRPRSFSKILETFGTLVFEPNRKATDGQASRALRDTVSRLEERSKKLSEEKDRFQTLYASTQGLYDELLDKYKQLCEDYDIVSRRSAAQKEKLDRLQHAFVEAFLQS